MCEGVCVSVTEATAVSDEEEGRVGVCVCVVCEREGALRTATSTTASLTGI